jgi:hypothetical protein
MRHYGPRDRFVAMMSRRDPDLAEADAFGEGYGDDEGDDAILDYATRSPGKSRTQ